MDYEATRRENQSPDLYKVFESDWVLLLLVSQPCYWNLDTDMCLLAVSKRSQHRHYRKMKEVEERAERFLEKSDWGRGEREEALPQGGQRPYHKTKRGAP
ncbi:UNVERIFIED_CONTAM: hypothetical protein FKN15_036796 [Acipenser sinensis]